MKLNTHMPAALKPYYRAELENYRSKLREGDLAAAWHHLERAHVIGQAYPWEHSYVHWKMLKFGFRIKNSSEILGQLPRIFVGGVKSFVGQIPVGNTGGANIPPLRKLPIEDDIQEMFKGAGLG